MNFSGLIRRIRNNPKLLDNDFPTSTFHIFVEHWLFAMCFIQPFHNPQSSLVLESGIKYKGYVQRYTFLRVFCNIVRNARVVWDPIKTKSPKVC